MRLVTEPDFYNGGEDEVRLLNSLIRRLHEHLTIHDSGVWLVASGVHSRMHLTLQKFCGEHLVDNVTLDACKDDVLKLREVSKGDQGQPWFEFSLFVKLYDEPEIDYRWGQNPQVTPVDLVFDLVRFPRHQATLPEWYLS